VLGPACKSTQTVREGKESHVVFSHKNASISFLAKASRAPGRLFRQCLQFPCFKVWVEEGRLRLHTLWLGRTRWQCELEMSTDVLVGDFQHLRTITPRCPVFECQEPVASLFHWCLCGGPVSTLLSLSLCPCRAAQTRHEHHRPDPRASCQPPSPEFGPLTGAPFLSFRFSLGRLLALALALQRFQQCM